MRLVISLIPQEKNSLLEWETVALRQHWFWFTSIYFHQLQNWDLGLGRRTPLCMWVFVFFVHNSQGWDEARFSFLAMHFSSWKKSPNIYKAKEQERPSWHNATKGGNDELQKQWSHVPAHPDPSGNNSVWTWHLWADEQGGEMLLLLCSSCRKSSHVDVVNEPRVLIILPRYSSSSDPLSLSVFVLFISLLDSSLMEF